MTHRFKVNNELGKPIKLEFATLPLSKMTDNIYLKYNCVSSILTNIEKVFFLLSRPQLNYRTSSTITVVCASQKFLLGFVTIKHTDLLVRARARVRACMCARVCVRACTRACAYVRGLVCVKERLRKYAWLNSIGKFLQRRKQYC